MELFNPKKQKQVSMQVAKAMHLQKNPLQYFGLSKYQKVLIFWLYCQTAQTAALSTIDISSQCTLNTLMGRILKQSYVNNYQNQLTSAISKTKTKCSKLQMTKTNHEIITKKQNATIQLQSFTIGTQPLMNQELMFKNTEFYSAYWINYNLQQKLKTRNSNIKRVLQELFEKANLLLIQKIFQGLTVKISGRLSKQGMAKTVSKTCGVLPHSGLKQKVDYDIGFVTTKLGCLGIKVWVFY